MRATNGNASRAREESPLLGAQSKAGSDYGSVETLTDQRRTGDEEYEEDNDKANQQVGRARGLLIILSLWGLIFLQGRSRFRIFPKRLDVYGG
jgi:hypothetical protein